MPENKTKPIEQSVAAFIDAISADSQRADAKALVQLMQKATGEKPKLWGPSIIGFGTHHYVYESGREGDTCVVGFSPRKAATVLYGVTGFDGADQMLAKLGKHTTGKGCLYVKKLSEIDAKILEKMIGKAVAAKRSRSRA